MHSSIAIIGASSAIAYEVAVTYAGQGASLFITARGDDKCVILRDDLLARGARRVHACSYDAEREFEQRDITQEIASLMPECSLILVAYGVLSDTEACSHDVARTVREFTLNATSVIAVCTQAGMFFERQTTRTHVPCIAAISSVAGDRGRGSNYVYGAAKGAVTLFLQGMRNRLFSKGIHVVTIKPGFVATPMTAHLPHNPLFASPRSVAASIVKAIESRKDVVYTPGYWRYILMIVRAIPERIFKRLHT